MGKINDINKCKAVMLPTSELKPYKKNTKKHDETQINNVATSIQQNGFVQPIVVDKSNVVIIGHCRLLAAEKLNLDKVPVIVADWLNKQQIDKLRIIDNKSNESEWDFDFLQEELSRLDFSDYDFDFSLTADVSDEDIDALFGETETEKEKEPQKIKCPFCNKEFEI